MNYNLSALLDGLFAYDTGCNDSGIHDEKLRKQTIEQLENMSDDDFRIFISEYIREKFLSEKAIKEGYGIEDVKAFIDWLDEYMECCI